MFIEIFVNSAVHLTNCRTFQDGRTGLCKVKDYLSFEKKTVFGSTSVSVSQPMVKSSLCLSNSWLLDKCFVLRHQAKKRGQTETRVDEGSRARIALKFHFVNSLPFMITECAKTSRENAGAAAHELKLFSVNCYQNLSSLKFK